MSPQEIVRPTKISGYKHVYGVFPSGTVNFPFGLQKHFGGSWTFGWCPRCGRSKRHVIRHRGLPFRWFTGVGDGESHLRTTIACERCHISWDVYQYDKFKLIRSVRHARHLRRIYAKPKL